MTNKEKKQKRKDKKRRQRAREKRGTLPTSVQALLGYLGNGGPMPAPQTDVKVRERAGVDNIDTLSQIIRQQQVQSASYMQTLQNTALRNDVTNQLKEQSTKLNEQTSNHLRGVVAAVEETRDEVAKVRRQYNFKSIDDKIEKAKRALLAEHGKKLPNADKLAIKQAEVTRLEGIKVQEQSLGTSRYQPPMAAMAQIDNSLPSAPVARGGGGAAAVPKRTNTRAGRAEQIIVVAPAEHSRTLSIPANDPHLEELNRDLEHMNALQAIPSRRKSKQGGVVIHDDVEVNVASFANAMWGGVSSGNASNSSPSLLQFPLRNSPKPQAAAFQTKHRIARDE
jgi:hypothetical protein